MQESYWVAKFFWTLNVVSRLGFSNLLLGDLNTNYEDPKYGNAKKLISWCREIQFNQVQNEQTRKSATLYLIFARWLKKYI